MAVNKPTKDVTDPTYAAYIKLLQKNEPILKQAFINFLQTSDNYKTLAKEIIVEPSKIQKKQALAKDEPKGLEAAIDAFKKSIPSSMPDWIKSVLTSTGGQPVEKLKYAMQEPNLKPIAAMKLRMAFVSKKQEEALEEKLRKEEAYKKKLSFSGPVPGSIPKPY